MAQREIIHPAGQAIAACLQGDRQGTPEIESSPKTCRDMYAAPASARGNPGRAAGAADHHDLAKPEKTARPSESARLHQSRILAKSEELSSTRRAACRSPNITRRSSVPARVRRALHRSRRQVHEEDAEGLYAPASSTRSIISTASVHRLSLQAEARPRAEEILQGRQAHGRSSLHSLSRHPRLSRASTSFLWARKTWMAGTKARP